MCCLEAALAANQKQQIVDGCETYRLCGGLLGRFSGLSLTFAAGALSIKGVGA
jgi:hypothetical protein